MSAACERKPTQSLRFAISETRKSNDARMNGFRILTMIGIVIEEYLRGLNIV